MRTGARLAATGAILLASGVLIGAFGTHALAGTLEPDARATFETAVRYHLLHGLGLLALAALARTGIRGLHGPGRLLTIGILLFAATLYGLAIGGPRGLGAVAPVGGTLLVAGWIWVAVRVLVPRQTPGGEAA